MELSGAWILIFYLGAPQPWDKPIASISQIGEFASLEACTAAAKQIRVRLGERGMDVGFDCIDSTTGRTSSQTFSEANKNLETMENLLSLFGDKPEADP